MASSIEDSALDSNASGLFICPQKVFTIGVCKSVLKRPQTYISAGVAGDWRACKKVMLLVLKCILKEAEDAQCPLL